MATAKELAQKHTQLMLDAVSYQDGKTTLEF